MMNSIFRGVGQVMFQGNALSGALMLAGIACNSLLMCLFALAGSAIGTCTAVALRYDGGRICDGLYGFNAALVGIAVPCFMPIHVASVLLMVVACVLSTLVTRLFERQRLAPALTAPFVLITWAMLLLSHIFPQLQLPATTAADTAESFSLMRAASLSFGQIMLQGNNLLTGLLFLLVICVNSCKMGMESLVACALCLTVVWVPGVSTTSVNNGIYGYNAILAVLAVANILGIGSWTYVKALVALILTLLIQYVGLHMGFVTLTAPFVLSVWLVVLYQTFVVKTKQD
ncbi:urea transporter [Hoylesella timonensis]|uniref:urea transporter n=1 Tax=Hoylesella timonensis TaxID=386414 RepID=UPI001F2655E9|nr:urea transporter [Hoylesella timonensis]